MVSDDVTVGESIVPSSQGLPIGNLYLLDAGHFSLTAGVLVAIRSYFLSTADISVQIWSVDPADPSTMILESKFSLAPAGALVLDTVGRFSWLLVQIYDG